MIRKILFSVLRCLAILLVLSGMDLNVRADIMTTPNSLKNKTPVSKLNELQAAQELEYLAREIKKHNKAYFVDNTPLISDAEYDQLFCRNQTI